MVVSGWWWVGVGVEASGIKEEHTGSQAIQQLTSKQRA